MADMMLQKCLTKGINDTPLWSTAGTVYQVLMDEERTLKFKKVIDHTIRNGDVVVDIGTGSGILSCFAIMAGAKFVYAIESDPSNYKMAETVIRDNDMVGKIKLILGDALKVELPKKVDVVICELMSTAVLDEPQIRIMNYAVKTFLKKDGITIPRRAITFGEYVTSNHYHYGIKLRVPQYEWTWIDSKSQKISETATLFEIDLSKINKEDIHCSGNIKIIKRGVLNGIRLFTRTYLTEDIVHDSSMGFCPRIVIPTVDEIVVDVGDTVHYDIYFKAGCGYASIKLDVSKTTSKTLGGER